MPRFNPIKLMSESGGDRAQHARRSGTRRARSTSTSSRSSALDRRAAALRPVVAESFPLRAGADAHRYMTPSGKNVGKVCSTPCQRVARADVVPFSPRPSPPPPSGGIARGGRVAANPAGERQAGREKEQDDMSDSGHRDEQDRVLIFDTTLRDGEQSPGISLNTQEKLEIAHQLARLGVDVIEAGFPITSPGDFESVQAIAREVRGPGDLRAGAHRQRRTSTPPGTRSSDSERPRIHTFIATSDIHIERKLQTTREDVKGQARAAVAHARELLRRRRVLARGRLALGRRVHGRGASRSRSTRARRRSTSPTPSATRCRDEYAAMFERAVPARARPARRRRLGALPRRPRAGGRELARRRAGRLRARSSARSTASASAPATPRSRRS